MSNDELRKCDECGRWVEDQEEGFCEICEEFVCSRCTEDHEWGHV